MIFTITSYKKVHIRWEIISHRRLAIGRVIVNDKYKKKPSELSDLW